MKRTLLMALGAVALTAGICPNVMGQVPFGPRSEEERPRFPDFNTVVRGAKEIREGRWRRGCGKGLKLWRNGRGLRDVARRRIAKKSFGSGMGATNIAWL